MTDDMSIGKVLAENYTKYHEKTVEISDAHNESLENPIQTGQL